MTTDREHIGQAPNPMGIEGLEFVEFATAKPQALGQSLEAMPLAPIGVWLGVWLTKRIPSTWFYRVAYSGMALTGAKLLWDGL